MSRSLRSVVGSLVAGAGIQRVLGLVNTVLLARALGVERLGELAFALQFGIILGLFADAGIRSVATREASAAPERAGAWIRASIRARLLVAAGLYVLFAGAVGLVADAWPLYLLGGATVFGSACDLKELSEAGGLTRTEVGLEALASVVYVALTATLMALGVRDLVWHAGAALVARFAYAGGVLGVVRRLAVSGPRPSVRGLIRSSTAVSLVQSFQNLVLMSDVILIRLLSSPFEVGLYTVGRRLSIAAEAPAALANRAVQPHLHHAAARGDAAGTLRRALGIAAYASLPVAIGGWVLATPLLERLFGAEYAGSTWPLRWLLAVAVIAGVGSRFGMMLFAKQMTRAYAVPVAIGAAANLLLSLVLIPRWGAAGSALATAVATTVIVLVSAALLRRHVPLGLPGALLRPIAVAAAVGGAAAVLPGSVDPLLRVLAGAVVFVVLVLLLEGRSLFRLGEGLHAASGLPEHVASDEGSGA